jgi:transposase InsO family protein
VEVLPEDESDDQGYDSPDEIEDQGYNPQLSRFEQDSCHHVRSHSSSKLPEHLETAVQATDLEDEEQKQQLRELLRRYQKVMAPPDVSLGTTHMVEHRIDTGEARPIKQAARRLPKVREHVVEEALEEMTKAKAVRPSESPWSSPIVLVKKKDGTIRFCVDYRELNAVTKTDAYPLPRIDDCLDSLGQSQWYCTLDLRSGYYQVPMAPEDVEKTAFVTKFGLYEFLVMPFGLTNAPATFERLMEKVLNGLQWRKCLVYIDDIIVFGKDFLTTLSNLEEVFDRLEKANLSCKPKKCALFRKKVSFLGHVVSAEGISCDPAKIAAVKDWPTPKTVKEVRSFLGLASYYRRFIPNFAHISSSLVDLTKKDERFHWDEEQELSFQLLKDALCSDLVLTYPSDQGFFILDTDASDNAIGAVLSQVDPSDQEKEKVIAYASKTLSPTERRYCTTRKELLAVVTFVKQFRHFLTGRRFLLRTDHASLMWLLKFKNPEGILARWLTTLSEYMPFDCIQHRAGSQHANADALSRRPMEAKNCPSTYQDCPTCYPRIITQDVDGVTTISCEEEIEYLPLRKERACVMTRSQHRDMEKQKEASQDIPEDNSVPVITGDITPDMVTSPPRADFDHWALGWKQDYISQEQRKCHDLAQILRWKEKSELKPELESYSHVGNELKGYLSMWESLHLLDGILYRKVQFPYQSNYSYQLVVPPALRGEAMHRSHNLLQAGHQGEDNTMAILRRRFYWPGYRHACRTWVRGCIVCQKRRPRTEGKAPLYHVGAGNPGECIAMDILGPLPLTVRGNQYIIVLSDMFTKWTEAYALPDKTASSVGKILINEYICRYGIPARIHSDQGKEFQNELMNSILRIMGIARTRTTPYRPQSDGQVERFNRTLIKMLKSFVDSPQSDQWDDLLPLLTSAYRATEHKSTGCTPNLLFLGREVDIPLDILAGPPPGEKKVWMSSNGYGAWLQRALSNAHQYARQHLEKAAFKQKAYYDRQSSSWKPREGEWVYYYYPPRAQAKLGTPWEGPYVIVKRLKGNTVIIARDQQSKERIVHQDNLKSILGPQQSENNWVRDQLRDLKKTYPKTSLVEEAVMSPESSEDEEPISISVAPPILKKTGQAWKHATCTNMNKHVTFCSLNNVIGNDGIEQQSILKPST